MKKRVHICARKLPVWMVLLILIFNMTAVGCSAAEGFSLTAGEEAYIQSIKDTPLVVSATSDLSYHLAGSPARECGLLVPLLELLRSFGLTIRMKQVNWGEGQTLDQEEEVDLMGLAMVDDTRRKKYIYTDPLQISHAEFFANVNNPVGDIVNISNKKVGTTVHSAQISKAAQYLGNSGNVLYFPNADALFDALNKGEIDCALGTANSFFEAIAYENVVHEITGNNIQSNQAVFTAKETLRPLIEIVNRYLRSPLGEDLVNRVEQSSKECILERAREHYAGEIADLASNYADLTVYDGMMMYPLSYSHDGQYKGYQKNINDTFCRLTGKSIRVVDSKEYPDGLLSVVEDVRTGKLLGATSVYYDSELDNDAGLVFSIPIFSDKLSIFAIKESIPQRDIKIAATFEGHRYLNTDFISKYDPIEVGSRMMLMENLKKGMYDAIFISEMSVDYSYSILKDYRMYKIYDYTTLANLHGLLNPANESFNKLFNAAIKLHSALYPNDKTMMTESPREDKFTYMRLQDKLYRQQSSFILALSWLLCALIVLLAMVLAQLRRLKRYEMSNQLALMKKANTDFLAALNNRRGIHEIINEYYEDVRNTEGNTYFIMLDIDDFKKINDTYGHHVGDKVIAMVADRIRKTYDDFEAARWGGEEFLVLHRCDNIKDCFETTERLRTFVEDTVLEVKNVGKISVTVSCGISAYPQNTPHEDCIKEADLAMYQAKANGKNNTVVSKTVQQ